MVDLAREELQFMAAPATHGRQAAQAVARLHHVQGLRGLVFEMELGDGGELT